MGLSQSGLRLFRHSAHTAFFIFKFGFYATPYTLGGIFKRNYAGVQITASSLTGYTTPGLYVVLFRSISTNSHVLYVHKVDTSQVLVATDTTDISSVSYVDNTKIWISYSGQYVDTLAAAIWDEDIGSSAAYRLLRRPFDWLIPV